MVNVVYNGTAMPGFEYCPHREPKISSRGFSFLRCLVVVQDEGWAVLCSLSNQTQDMNHHYHMSQVEPTNR